MIDLRTDAVTQPTDAMWDAMRSAPPGWAPAGEDPSVIRIQQHAAELTGMESALFLPTGSMGNLVALAAHTQPGDQIILESSSHIAWSEEWGYASVCGLAARSIVGRHGALDPEDVRIALRDRRFDHQPRTSLVCLENTHNMAGGTVLSPAQTEAVATVAHEHGAQVHLDGARVVHAAVALQLPVRALTASVDSVTIGLCKGLSAPGGAVLCGSESFIARAHIALRRIGGHSMPQAGILAAAGVVALEQMIPRLADDHRRARRLAEALVTIDGLHVDLASVQTNIVMAQLDPHIGTARMLVDTLATHDVRACVYSMDTGRFVTHRHIDDDAIAWAIHGMRLAVDEVREHADRREETACSTF